MLLTRRFYVFVDFIFKVSQGASNLPSIGNHSEKLKLLPLICINIIDSLYRGLSVKTGSFLFDRGSLHCRFILVFCYFRRVALELHFHFAIGLKQFSIEYEQGLLFKYFHIFSFVII